MPSEEAAHVAEWLGITLPGEPVVPPPVAAGDAIERALWADACAAGHHFVVPVVLSDGDHVADLCRVCLTLTRYLDHPAFPTVSTTPKKGTAMTNTTQTTNYGGTSILGLLGIAFVVLKLCGVIDWSWWLVTLPFWGGFVVLLMVLAVIGVVLLVGKRRRRRRFRRA